MADLPSGTVLGQFRIDSKIGDGGMATVYKATQPSLHRTVAVKVMTASLAHDPTFVARFRREANTVAQLMHPNIVPVYDYGEDGRTLYIAMGFVPGGSLAERMEKPMDLATIVRIVGQVADALDYAHQKGVVHRDIKPANILLGEGDWAVLSDFGIARMLEGQQRLTQRGMGIGTPEYMSPEQGTSDNLDGRSDIYSLGIVLYELLTGEVPFDAETPYAILYKHVHDPLPLPSKKRPEIPAALENVVIRATAKQPEDRYQTAGQFKEALAAAMPTDPLESSPVVSKIRNVLYDLESESNTPSSTPVVRRQRARQAAPDPPGATSRSVAPVAWIVAVVGGLIAIAVIVGLAVALGPR
jgi:serine/threonine protein kinase